MVLSLGANAARPTGRIDADDGLTLACGSRQTPGNRGSCSLDRSARSGV